MITALAALDWLRDAYRWRGRHASELDADGVRVIQQREQWHRCRQRLGTGGAARTGYQRADVDGLSGTTRASAALTAELKGLSVEELRGQSDKYKALLEARDLEDVLFSG